MIDGCKSSFEELANKKLIPNMPHIKPNIPASS